mmetsp:Transcript_12683/g.21350  ORF Transcript_12683/g.21350 Transcript_12683/m.21350 type:complete len:201 (+) Transcript_12683:3570-4172(+)
MQAGHGGGGGGLALLGQHRPLPLLEHAVYRLLPLLQHLEALPKAHLHQPPLPGLGHPHGRLPGLPAHLAGPVRPRHDGPGRDPQGLPSPPGGAHRPQRPLLLRLREVLHRLVRQVLGEETAVQDQAEAGEAPRPARPQRRPRLPGGPLLRSEGSTSAPELAAERRQGGDRGRVGDARGQVRPLQGRDEMSRQPQLLRTNS